MLGRKEPPPPQPKPTKPEEKITQETHELLQPSGYLILRETLLLVLRGHHAETNLLEVLQS